MARSCRAVANTPPCCDIRESATEGAGVQSARLRSLRSAASSARPAERPNRSRQRQRRLSVTEVAELIKEYESQVPVGDLAKKFGVHRLTVTAHLQRHGVELRQVGLAPEDITTAALLYGQGWSLARLGEVQRGLHDCMASPASRWRRNAVVEPTRWRGRSLPATWDRVGTLGQPRSLTTR
jgi:hypothetical protein